MFPHLKTELKQLHKPTKKYMFKTTTYVFLSAIIGAIVFAGIDVFFSFLIGSIVK